MKIETHRFLLWPILGVVLYSALFLALLDCQWKELEVHSLFITFLLGILGGMLIPIVFKSHIEEGFVDFDSMPSRLRTFVFLISFGTLSLAIISLLLWKHLPLLLALFFLTFFLFLALAVARFEKVSGQKLLCNKPIFFESLFINGWLYWLLWGWVFICWRK